VSAYRNYAAYQSSTGEDADSPNANPLFVNLGATPADFDIAATSPAVNAGSASLSCSVGWCDPAGSSPNSIYGATDFVGNPRLNGAGIDIGAYQSTGVANSLTVALTAGTPTLSPPPSRPIPVMAARREERLRLCWVRRR
jgi:hypothetical protein